LEIEIGKKENENVSTEKMAFVFRENLNKNPFKRTGVSNFVS
jgi:hypothetical protein